MRRAPATARRALTHAAGHRTAARPPPASFSVKHSPAPRARAAVVRPPARRLAVGLTAGPQPALSGWRASAAGRALLTAGLLAVALGPGLAGASELYSWQDEDGVLHLTNMPEGRRYRPYQGTDAVGFGGEAPIVLKMQGQPRVLYRVNVRRFDALFREAARYYRLPFAFLKAVAKVESNFNPKAVSRAQAKGLMQMIDTTAARMNVDDPFDPEQSIFGGARYLRMLANEFEGNMALVAAAYNAGPDRVRRARGIPRIRETQRYVRRVLQMYRYYRQHP